MIDTPDHSNKFHQDNLSPLDKLSREEKSWHNFLRWVIYLVFLSCGGGLSYGWYFLNQKLSPLVETELTNFMNRPLKLGKVQWVSLSGVRFGESEIPPTDTDSDSVSVKAIDIQINPLKLLAQKKLELDLSLIEPYIYIEQDDSQSWIKTKLDNGIPEFKGIKIQLNSIHLHKTNLTLKAKSERDNLQPDVQLKLNSSNVYFNPQFISFETKGNLREGGKIDIDGFYKKSQQQLGLSINGEEISSEEINNLLPLPLELSSGKISSNLQINLNPHQQANIIGKATLNKVNISIPNLSQSLTQTNGEITFQTSSVKLNHIQTNFALIPTEVKGSINNNGEINLEGNTKPTNFNQVLNSLNLPQPSLPIKGKIKADFQVKGTLAKPRLTAQLSTTNKANLDKVKLNDAKANLELFDSHLLVTNLTLLPSIGGEVMGEGKVSLDEENSQFSFDINAHDISGPKIAQVYGQNWPQEIGNLSGKYNISGSWQQANLFQLTGKTTIEVAEGQAIISNLKHDRHNWQANLELSQINLAKIPNNICQNIDCRNSLLNGKLAISGSNKVITPTTISAKGNGSLNLAGEKISFTNLELNQGHWHSLITTQGLELAKISPSLAPLEAKINSNLNIAGNLENSTEIIAFGDGELILPQGNIAINNLQLKDSNFTTEVHSNSLKLASFSSELRGEAKGKLKVTGNLNNLNPDQLKISGDLDFTEGIGLIKQPLKTTFSWNGENLFINKLNSQGIQGKGIINVNLETQQIDNFNLDLSANGIDLNSLPLPLPSQLKLLTYQGKFDFEGKVFGNHLDNPNILGNVALNNLAIAGFNFNPLVGKIEANINEGVDLNLAEKGTAGDLMRISLDSQSQPTEINLRVDNTTITGINKENIFSVSLSNFPIGKLSQSFPDDLFSSVNNLAGTMSAKFDVNLNNYDLNASEITIKNPVFANFKGDLITTNLAYTQGKININDGKITKNNSNYLFEARVYPLQKDPQLEAKLTVEQGNIQDLLESLEIFTWSDFQRGLIPPQYATAKDLYSQNNIDYDSNSPQALVSAGKKDAPFGDQLKHFNEVSILITQKQEEKLASSLPELEELKGNYDGTIAVNGSLKEGIEAEFNFEGKNWQWGRYQANLIEAKGTYKDGLLTLLPIKIQQEKTLFSLLGSFNQERLSGQLRIVNLPVNEFGKIIAVPDLINLDGMLNANVAISGSQESPLAKGEISINDTTINNTKIKSNKVSFSYKNSRLNFFANSILNKEFEPLTIKGSFPYQLFSNSIAPENNQFNISLKMKENVFPLVNAISNNEIKWLKGKGNINLDIQGNYHQEKNQLTDIETKGVASLEDSVIAAKIFPDKPFTEINGKILFNFDQIKVENLSGKFSGGDVKISGSLPLIEKTPTVNPLTIDFSKLAINLEELYQGEVNGNLNISGSAIAPKLTGNLQLFNGEIFLSEERINNSTSKDNESVLAKTKFEDLNLILGSNIKIVKTPILSVTATGNLSLNGSLNQPQPEGNIYLTQGQVNLFTSQLKLAEGHQNIAKFTSENGLDPYLDIQLLASVTETNRHQFVDSPIASEIKDLSNSQVGQVQTIRVKANVKGLTSQLTEKLELTSSPQRSESEIIALLGGGFFNNFSSQENSNLGLANLASAAFLGSFQGQLGEALGLSEFRIFPTQIINSEKRTSTLGLGAEMGLDIGNNFSVSVMKILTNEQAPQYSIRYRLNDKALVRGSTDFGNDSRGSVEFEHRF